MRPSDSKSYAGGGVYTPGRASQAGKVKAWGPDQRQSHGPPGMGVRLKANNLILQKEFITETATKTTNILHAHLPRSSNRMTTSGESQKETTGMKLDVMSAKTKTRIGFWNVRTMYETGKLAQVTTEMRRYNLHVLGVSESRWIGTGRLKTVSGETVLYSGRDDELHREGVAIILKKGSRSR